MKCAACGKELREGARFCPSCGVQVDTSPLKAGAEKKGHDRCPHCGASVKAGVNFCPKCGSVLEKGTVSGEPTSEQKDTHDIHKKGTPQSDGLLLCSLCKRKVEKGLKSCPYCGNVLPPDGSPLEESPEKPVKAYAHTGKRKHAPHWAKTAGIFLFLALAAGVSGAWIGTQLHPVNDPEDQVVSDNSSVDDADAETGLQQDQTEKAAADDAKPGAEMPEDDIPDDNATATDGQDYILPGSDSRYISKSELEGFTKEDCRIARNEIYARHGRMFDDETLQAYFNSLGWYSPSIAPDDFDESLLNDYERANLDVIIAYEAEQGYR